MMYPEELEKLIREGENTSLELKYDISPEVETVISAFANTYGGYIIFGFKGEGKVVGLTDRQIQDYSKRLQALCQVMNVEYELFPSNFDMKVVMVLRIAKNQFKYQVRTSDGHAYIRVGANTVLSNVSSNYISKKANSRQLKCFVAMSFREQEYPRLVDFYDAMQRAAKRCAYRLKVWKNDDKPFNGDAVNEIKENIK